jgi:hypothetical protein
MLKNSNSAAQQQQQQPQTRKFTYPISELYVPHQFRYVPAQSCVPPQLAALFPPARLHANVRLCRQPSFLDPQEVQVSGEVRSAAHPDLSSSHITAALKLRRASPTAKLFFFTRVALKRLFFILRLCFEILHPPWAVLDT